jgi:predicted ATPase
MCLAIATEHHLALPRAWNMGIVGWCAVERGDWHDGIALLSDAIAAMRSVQSRHFMAYLIGLLAHAQLKAGHHPKAMEAVAEGIALTEVTGECFYSAELHRLRGEISLHSSIGRNRHAEASFQKAIAIARRQGARTLERRAHQSLRHLEDL